MPPSASVTIADTVPSGGRGALLGMARSDALGLVQNSAAVFLTISTTHRPATGLGRFSRKNPRAFDAFGVAAYVFTLRPPRRVGGPVASSVLGLPLSVRARRSLQRPLDLSGTRLAVRRPTAERWRTGPSAQTDEVER